MPEVFAGSLIRAKQNKRRCETALGWEVRSGFKAGRLTTAFRECGVFITSYQDAFFFF